jgi:hypothetical protein
MSKSKPRNDSANLWAALRDVVNNSINKGQLPILGFFGLIALWLWKITPDAAERAMEKVVVALKERAFWSYVSNVALIALWFFHSKYIRRSVSKELDRVGEEKSQLQAKLLERNLSSAKK